MLNIFKSRKTQASEKRDVFKLGENSFTIDQSESTVQIIDNKIIGLTIKTSEKEFETLSESDSFEFSWALHSPMFYARELDLTSKRRFVISDENMYDHEVALYFMEHCDTQVTIELKDNCLTIVGFADVFGVEYPLEIFLRY